MKHLFLLLTVAAAAVGCTKSSVFTIHGTLADSTYNGQTVYLTDINTNRVLDSCLITGADFNFSTNPDSVSLLSMNLGRFRATVIAQAGVADVALGRPSKIGGTPLNDSLQIYLDQIAAGGDIAHIINAHYAPNAGNAFGRYLVMEKLSPRNSYNLYQIDSVLGSVPALDREFGGVKRLRQSALNLENTQVGKQFADFSGIAPNGATVCLSDYAGKGNYTLVDFWASWCGPCKREIPVLKELYEAYNGRGLQIVGVNVWDTRPDFETAVADFELPWAQICNFKDRSTTDLYGVNSIPQILLIDPAGTIVKRNLKGEDMKAVVAALYK